MLQRNVLRVLTAAQRRGGRAEDDPGDARLPPPSCRQRSEEGKAGWKRRVEAWGESAEWSRLIGRSSLQKESEFSRCGDKIVTIIFTEKEEKKKFVFTCKVSQLFPVITTLFLYSP